MQGIVENKRHADIQIVVMDGGSTDNSVEIIQRYQTKIHYWQSESDGGQAAAINDGGDGEYRLLRESSGLNAMAVNAQHMKAVAGRKTGVKDSEWNANLLQHDLL